MAYNTILCVTCKKYLGDFFTQYCLVCEHLLYNTAFCVTALPKILPVEWADLPKTLPLEVLNKKY